MAIKETNTRIIITISKKQAKWIKDQCEILKITPSKYISWLLAKKTNDLANYLRLIKNPNKEELEELIRIAKTPWID